MKWLPALLLCLGMTCAFAAQDAGPFVRGSHQQIVAARAGSSNSLPATFSIARRIE